MFHQSIEKACFIVFLNIIDLYSVYHRANEEAYAVYYTVRDKKTPDS